MSTQDELFTKINTKDKELITSIVEYYKKDKEALALLDEKPINKSHISFLENLLSAYTDQAIPQKDILSTKHSDIESEWENLLSAAIACLRRKDKREPFAADTEKLLQPTAYGVDALKKYYGRFVEFEDILYGADRWYRDHVVHVYRVWLLGMNMLIPPKNGSGSMARDVATGMGVDGYKERDENAESPEASNFIYSESEIYSAWTVAALTHDLGYPLEKAPKLLRTVHDMMTYFVVAPDLKHDFRFNTAADSINDYIVRLISTKMVRQLEFDPNDKERQIYCGRVQPKYYLKFLKSLELHKHGIISSILLYKSLVFFLESDCNLNEDYHFNGEEARQFYLRREILRAIATHTCDDVYLMFVPNFSFLLFFADELQDWGRNKFHGIKQEDVYMLPPEWDLGEYKKITVEQQFIVRDSDSGRDIQSYIPGLKGIGKKLMGDFIKHKKVFREGIDTDKRAFSYRKIATIKFEDISNLTVSITIDIPLKALATITYNYIGGETPQRTEINKCLHDDIKIPTA